MANIVGKLVKGLVIRATRLQDDGTPYPSGTEAAQLVTNGFISITVTGNTTEVSEISVTLADGTPCIYIPATQSFANFSIDISLCGVDPELLATITNVDQYQNYAGDEAGILARSGRLDKNFALEIWTNTYSMPGTSGYILFPFVKAGIFNGFTLSGDAAADFTLSGLQTEDGTAWESGPYDVMMDTTQTPPVPAPLPSDLPTDAHMLMVWSSAPVPEPTGGLVAMP